MTDEDVTEVEILIIGAGPAGLGAASRLSQLLKKPETAFNKRFSHDGDHEIDYTYLKKIQQQERSNNVQPFLIIDASNEAGGLASTVTTPENFLFDLGGHVMFSHYAYFDELVTYSRGAFDDPTAFARHERASYVYMRKTFIPYPMQLNLCKLPVEDQILCLNGLIDAKCQRSARLLSTDKDNNSRPSNFDEWIRMTMGKGLYDVFMKPYNFKVWAYPPIEMQCSWLGERVATVDTERVVQNLLRKKEEKGWGPNATFYFPQSGGTGSIWKAVADNAIPKKYQQYNSCVTKLDERTKTVTLGDGRCIKYNRLISTMPLDFTLTMLGRKDLANRLRFSSSYIIGIGIRGCNPFDKKCWLYYPENDCPFYRCTIFSHYATRNCPASCTILPTIRYADSSIEVDETCSKAAGPYHSLMLEVSSSICKRVDENGIIDETIAGAIATKLLQPQSEIVSIFHRKLERGYPTPHIDRDLILEESLPLLKRSSIWSIGRFGAWKYEVSNQDHSVMQGVEAVDNILFGTDEVTLNSPDIVNTKGARQEYRRYLTPQFE